MKGVCMLITKFHPHIGGIQFQALKLSRELNRQGVKVYVLTRNYNKLSAHEFIDGIEVYRFPVLGKSRLLASLPYMVLCFLWLIMHQDKYQIIHCHQAYAPATIGVMIKTILQKKVLVKVTATNEYGEMRELEKLPFSRLRKRLLSAVDKFIAITDQVGKELAAIGIKEDRIVYIPNGVDIPEESSFSRDIRMASKLRLNISYDKVVVFSGRLAEEKGVDTLLNAWAIISKKYPTWHLVILGDGGPVRNREAEIKQLASQIDENNTIHFLGWVNNVADYLFAADAYCLPSISEGLSNSLLEAMAAGTAVVVSDIDANRFMVKDGLNGLLFETGNAQELADNLIKTLQDESLLERLGRSAKSTVKEKCSFDNITKQYIDLYQNLSKNE